MVVEFTETWQRPDTASIVDIGGWQTISGGAGIGIKSTVATNSAATGDVATQEATRPTVKDQWVRAVVGSAVESGGGDTADILIGGMALRGTNAYGFGVRLNYAAAGVRILDFVEGTGVTLNDFVSIGVPANVTLKSSGGSDLSVPQILYFAMTTVRGGMRLRAAVNNEDLDEPDIEFVIGKDVPDNYPTSPANFGDWWFAFGTTVASDVLSVFEFSALDELEVVPRETGISIANQLTLSEIRERVLQRYTGGGASNSNLDKTYVNEEINSSIAEIWQAGVDIFTFAEPEGEVTVLLDSNGFWIAPYYIESVLGIWDSQRRTPSTWHEWSRTEDDRAIIKFRRDIEPSSITALVRYRARLMRMDNDEDACAIPRQYSDIIELGAMRNLARDDSVANRFKFYDMRFEKRLDDMKRMENHKRQQRKRRVAALRTTGRIPGQLAAYGTTGV